MDDPSANYCNNLWEAIKAGNTNQVKLGLSTGAKLASRPQLARTRQFMLLEEAIRIQHKDIVDVLLAHGFDELIKDNYAGILETAFSRGNKEIIGAFIDKIPDINARCLDGGNILTIGLMSWKNHKSIDLIECLLSKGANVNHVDPCGSTPLMCAVDQQVDIKVIELLLAHGAELNQVNLFETRQKKLLGTRDFMI